MAASRQSLAPSPSLRYQHAPAAGPAAAVAQPAVLVRVEGGGELARTFQSQKNSPRNLQHRNHLPIRSRRLDGILSHRVLADLS
eukprot:765092-Hanusia_phi.AAC.5